MILKFAILQMGIGIESEKYENQVLGGHLHRNG